MHRVICRQRYLGIFLAGALGLPAPALAQPTHDKGYQPEDWQLTGTLGMNYSSGKYGTAIDTDVLLGIPSLSVETGGFKLSASLPYMQISGRGLVVFDASGNPILINRRTSGPTAVRSGWGDLNLSASYTIPAAILGDFEVRVSGITKVPTGAARRRLGTGKADYGVSLDVSRQFGDWVPFVTVGYLAPGEPAGFTLYDTASVSAGASLQLDDDLVVTGSYDFHSKDSPQVPAGHDLFGSLTWLRDDHVNLTGYGMVGLNDGSPDLGIGFVVSYGLN
jgi:hypothetical protein